MGLDQWLVEALRYWALDGAVDRAFLSL